MTEKQTNKKFLETVVIVIGLVLIISFVVSYKMSWNKIVDNNIIFKIMFYYLYFICVRTIVLLGFSFYEYLYKGNLPELTRFPLVTILIPCFNEEKVVEDCLRSVGRINYPNLEILLIDDGSLDNTFENAKKIAQSDNRIRILLKENGGKSSALNLGLAEALGDYVLCMDADSRLQANVLELAMPYFEMNPHLSAIAGNVRVGNAHNLLTLFQKLEYIVGLNFHKMAQSAVEMVTIIPGPIGVFKKDVVLELGGYETDTFAEDCDLTIKLLLNGHHIKYNPDIIAVTEAPTNLYELLIQRYRWSRGTIQAIAKNAYWGFFKGFNWRNLIITSYMITETIIIPTLNFVFAMITLHYALKFDIVQLFGPFFAALVLLDMALAIYSVIFEREFKMLFFLAVISRMTYGIFLEVIRFLSMIDEILKVPMKWGALTRKGLRR